MVKIVIIGWYGTETIGDRAILSGIINLVSAVYQDFEIKLGSFNPTLSERTILEDYKHYCVSADKDEFSISVFDSSRVCEIDSAIKWADLLIMGGGPLMDCIQLYMVEYAFKKARKKKTKTAVIGCGMGPLIEPNYINAALSIISNSDLTIFRDNMSLSVYNALLNKKESGCKASIDPAVFAADVFNKQNSGVERVNNVISVNFREILPDFHSGITTKQITSLFTDFLRTLSEQESNDILLVPMHTFRVGGDDRYLLNQLANEVNRPNILVQNKPLSLEDTMQVYYNSRLCIVIRFHAILLQTILNGKNYIFDYTNAQNGKIINLLHQFDAYDIYKSRYYSLLQPKGDVFGITDDIPQYVLPEFAIETFRNIYLNNLKSIFDRT